MSSLVNTIQKTRDGRDVTIKVVTPTGYWVRETHASMVSGDSRHNPKHDPVLCEGGPREFVLVRQMMVCMECREQPIPLGEITLFGACKSCEEERLQDIAAG